MKRLSILKAVFTAMLLVYILAFIISVKAHGEETILPEENCSYSISYHINLGSNDIEHAIQYQRFHSSTVIDIK